MQKYTVKELKTGKCFASYYLKEDKRIEKLKDDDIIINFAYTDYGGDFFDKACIAYFKEKYPDNIIIENTVCNGENAILYGNKLVNDFLENIEDYLLGFENMEEFYSMMEYEQYENDFSYFLDDIKNDYLFNYDNVFEYLMHNKLGYYHVYPNMIDFSWDDLISELKENNLIFNKNEKLLYHLIDNGIEKNIANYYIANYKNNTLKNLVLSNSILQLFNDYENNVI